MKRKAICSLFIVIILCFSIGTFSVFAVSTGVATKIESAVNTSKVLNVYTSGTPSSGNNVTLYTANNSLYNVTQSWEFISVGNSKYKLVLTYYPDLGVNLNQATSKCTVYSVASNNAAGDYDDYQVTVSTLSNGANRIILPGWSKYLGHNGDYNGSQCYWYSTSGGYNSDYYWYFEN